MLPESPEIVVIGLIAALIFGAGKLDDLGEWVWQLRCWWRPELAESTGDDAESTEN